LTASAGTGRIALVTCRRGRIQCRRDTAPATGKQCRRRLRQSLVRQVSELNEGLGVRYAERVIVAGLCGAIIAMTIAAIVLHSIFADGGYTREALVDLSPCTFGAIGICGGSAGVMMQTFAGNLSLPWWMRPMVTGGLAGVAMVVLPIAAIEGPSHKGHLLKNIALVYGVPIGFVVGAAVALFRAVRCHAESGTPEDRGNSN